MPFSIKLLRRQGKTALAAILVSTAFSGSCFDSAIALRFRQAYVPGLTAGLSSAMSDPSNAETGLREAGAALIEGLGAILQPRPH